IAKHLVPNLAAARSINQNPAGRHLIGNPRSLIVEPDHVAVFGEQDLRRPRHARCDPRVAGELPVLSVYRHEMTRPDERKHELELSLAAMTGDVYVLVSLRNDPGVATSDMVHDPADRFLVAGDFAG